MQSQGVEAVAIHGDKDQEERNETIESFKVLPVISGVFEFGFRPLSTSDFDSLRPLGW